MSVVIDGTSGITFPDASSQSAAAASGYPAKAIAQFNGKNTATLNTDQNISSLTDNGTGDYTLGLSNANSGTTPVLVFGNTGLNTTYDVSEVVVVNGSQIGGTDPTTTAIRLQSGGGGSTDRDNQYISVAIFE